MKIILLESLSNLGKVGSVVNVKSGYARNCLIPQKKAAVATKSNIELFEVKKTEYLKKEESSEERARFFKDVIDGKNFILIRQASDEGRLFGSVRPGDVINEIQPLCPDIKLEKVAVNVAGIRQTGKHLVSINISAQTKAVINLIVSRTESEANVIASSLEEQKVSQ